MVITLWSFVDPCRKILFSISSRPQGQLFTGRVCSATVFFPSAVEVSSFPVCLCVSVCVGCSEIARSIFLSQMRIFPLFPSPHLQFPASFSSSPFSHFITARTHTHTHVCLHRFALEPNFRPRKMNNRPYNETMNLITLIQPVPIFCLMSSSKRYWIRCYCRQNIRHEGETNAVEQTLWVRKRRECKDSDSRFPTGTRHKNFMLHP